MRDVQNTRAIDTLETIAPETVKALLISEVVLALGSNYQAEKHLAYVQDKLVALGEAHYSDAYQNPDFTATPEHPKPDYVNQCVYLRLYQARTLVALQREFAALETDCNRCRGALMTTDTVRLVTMDIDTLLIKASDTSAEWQLLSNRMPLKAHEHIGVTALLEVMGLSDKGYMVESK